MSWLSIMPDDTERRRQEITAKFGELALRDVPLQELLDRAVRAVNAGTSARYVNVLEYRPERDDLLVRAGTGWKNGVVGHAALSSDLRSPPGYAFRMRQSVHIRDLRRQDEFEWAPLLREHGVVSLINVPITNDQFTYGVLEADEMAPHGWSEADADFLNGLAHLLSLAIQRKKTEEQRELLFREVQHRVKNNLQLIVAMLNMHARHAGDPESRRGFAELAQRVAVIGSVYQMLVTSRHVDRVGTRAYLSELCAKLELLAPDDTVQVEGRFDDRPMLLDDAIPLGLIVNELVTNSIKHAFGPAGGSVTVELRFAEDDGQGTLIVADNGRGMAADAADHLGLQIVRHLVRQLSGTMTRRPNAPGAVFEVRFRPAARGRLAPMKGSEQP